MRARYKMFVSLSKGGIFFGNIDHHIIIVQKCEPR